MRLRVLFFGVLRDRFGPQEQLLQFPGTSVADLLQYYRVIAPELAALWASVAVAVNQQYAAASLLLQEDDEVALLPPVSGGRAGCTGVRNNAQQAETPARESIERCE